MVFVRHLRVEGVVRGCDNPPIHHQPHIVTLTGLSLWFLSMSILFSSCSIFGARLANPKSWGSVKVERRDTCCFYDVHTNIFPYFSGTISFLNMYDLSYCGSRCEYGRFGMVLLVKPLRSSFPVPREHGRNHFCLHRLILANLREVLARRACRAASCCDEFAEPLADCTLSAPW